MTEKDRRLTELTAISPLDGRYRSSVEALAPFTSEEALIKTRIGVECKYLVALSEAGLTRPLKGRERKRLTNLGENLSNKQVKRVKEIEDTTHHDVKAMERTLREIFSGTSLVDLTEWIHFGLTSEDVNNLAYRLMFDQAKKKVCIPAIDQIVDKLTEQSEKYKTLPILGRTHGQAAVPTTYGKELIVFATRLNKETKKLEKTRLTGKLNGAVGNFNAHHLAFPEIDWIAFSQKFVRSLGLDPVIYTTQINPPEDLIENFQAFQRINGVLLDFDQDMWRYVSDYWLSQEVVKGEVSSSTMPQKVNPINFENSEGNLILANGIFETMGRKLSTSRLQRDLSDSTTIRNIGMALGYSLLSYKNTLIGLEKVYPNPEIMLEALNKDWSILTEGVQTVLRKEGVKDPYSLIAGLSRGQKIDSNAWKEWVNNLPIKDEVKEKLQKLTPTSYLGYAVKLTNMGIDDIEQ